MLNESPGKCSATCDWLMVRLSAYIFHSVFSSVVSGITVSTSNISTSAPSIVAPFKLTTCFSKSMPLLVRNNLFNCPLIRVVAIKSEVLTLVLVIVRSSMMTFFRNNGSSCTSTVMCSTSAIVSCCCIIRKPSIPKSKGNSRFTWSMLICIPVSLLA